MELWVSEANRLRADLPPAVQETLTRHEEAGTTDDPWFDLLEQGVPDVAERAWRIAQGG